MSDKCKKYYNKTVSSPNFSEMEEGVLRAWKEGGTFKKSIDARLIDDSPEYIFYDGPPFANGLPHYGHLLTSCVKDIFARYQTMKGKRVERRFGWDCHGLPAEMGAEKELGISGRAAIEEFGVDKFNSHCRESVMKYTDIWQDYINRAGRWVDFENDYKTMDRDYMESVMSAFKVLYDKGLVYESYRVMPYSWAAETPLSNFETRMDDSYRDREDKAVTVAFELEEIPEGAPKGCDKYYLLAWTTTPWTLPSNLALGVGEDMDYVCVVKDDATSPPLLVGDSISPPLLAGGVGGGVHTTRDPKIISNAKELRKNLTKAEKKLWSIIKSKQVENYKFRKQQPIGAYIADFVCHSKGLVIELDGSQHAEQKEYDKKRTAFLEEAGYTVLRFWNNDVLENPEGVYDVIVASLNELNDVHTPPPTPPASRGGEVGLSASGGGEVGLPASRGGETQCYILAKSSLVKYENELIGDNFKYGCDIEDAVQKSVEQELQNIKKRENAPTIKGSALTNLSYKPLFPYFKNAENAFKVLAADFIEEGSGTGIVHLAPGFGEDDQRVCAKNDIPVICPVDDSGKFTDEIFDIDGLSLKGLNVIADTNKSEDEPYNDKQLKKNGLANLRIITWLKTQKKLIKSEDYKHSYPHCWRTDEPLIYKAVPSWYVEVTKFRDRMVELNQNINWIPEHIRDGQFGKWLENARDWSISRNRFWGCPIPVWRTDGASGKIKVFGSIAELEEFFEVEVADLHKPFIDNLTKVDEETGETYRRVPDVFDCWFESGSMPFAQIHHLCSEDNFDNPPFPPADFIVEYVGQTRGWFYTLMVLSTALFDQEPFKNCICHGVILDTTGKKLSKKLRNYPDPNDMFDEYGADAMRWRMIKEPVMHGGNLLVSKDGNDIRDVVRLSIKPIWNAYHFFTLYANTDGVKANYCVDSDNLMDSYILAKLKQAVGGVEAALDGYDTPAACKAVDDFFEVLNNWYIRRSRDRFWRSSDSGIDDDKQAAYDTLYTVLVTMCQAAAPLLPLVTEEIYTGLVSQVNAENDVHTPPPTPPASRGGEVLVPASGGGEVLVPASGGGEVLVPASGGGEVGLSVHLQEFPILDKTSDEEIKLIEDMDVARDVCNIALAIRDKEKIRVRQPLQLLTIKMPDKKSVCDRMVAWETIGILAIIDEEVNVKGVIWDNSSVDSIASLKLIINFPILGKRLGKKMKEVAAAARKGDWKDLGEGKAEVAGEILEPTEFEIKLEPKDGIKGAQALSTNDALVVLDLEITPELKAEGIARDVVRFIQQSRKEADLNVSDRINIFIDTTEEIKNAIEIADNRSFIMNQTLAMSLDFGLPSSEHHVSETNIEGNKITISFAKSEKQNAA